MVGGREPSTPKLHCSAASRHQIRRFVPAGQPMVMVAITVTVTVMATATVTVMVVFPVMDTVTVTVAFKLRGGRSEG